jgi:hypothetical protein
MRDTEKQSLLGDEKASMTQQEQVLNVRSEAPVAVVVAERWQPSRKMLAIAGVLAVGGLLANIIVPMAIYHHSRQAHHHHETYSTPCVDPILPPAFVTDPFPLPEPQLVVLAVPSVKHTPVKLRVLDDGRSAQLDFGNNDVFLWSKEAYPEVSVQLQVESRLFVFDLGAPAQVQLDNNIARLAVLTANNLDATTVDFLKMTCRNSPRELQARLIVQRHGPTVMPVAVPEPRGQASAGTPGVVPMSKSVAASPNGLNRRGFPSNSQNAPSFDDRPLFYGQPDNVNDVTFPIECDGRVLNGPQAQGDSRVVEVHIMSFPLPPKPTAEQPSVAIKPEMKSGSGA